MRTKLFTPKDIANMRWFWSDYLKQKTGWLFVIFLMIVLQGFVLQQFLAITETGLRVIFTQGDLRDLFEVCALIFGIFAVRAATSFYSQPLGPACRRSHFSNAVRLNHPRALFRSEVF